MLPNFFVIGAGRSGTTSLHYYLAQHPDVFVCADKSPNFFVSHEPQPPWENERLKAMARHWVRDPREYEALFDAAGTRTAVGDVSPVYLQALSAPGRIHAACPGAKIVAILREPVSRAYAHFMGRRRDGLEPRTDFAQVAAAELAQPLPDAVAFGSYLGCGRYHHFLSGYFERFPPERIRVYLYEDLQADPRGLMGDLYAFLGVDPSFVPDMSERYGQTGLPANPLVRFIWTRSVGARTVLRPWLPRRVRDGVAPLVMNKLAKPPLDPVLRRRLAAVFTDEIERLQPLLNRDLSHWLAPAVRPASGAAASDPTAASGSSA